MTGTILVSGFLLRHPIGGHTWHHLQYLVGLRRLGFDVYYCEDFGWPDSCYNPSTDTNSSDPSYGSRYLGTLLDRFDLGDRWCYLAEDGTTEGLSRSELADICTTADLYLDLSNMNAIPETEGCKRRVLVDTDPVFTQIGGHGMGVSFDNYDVLLTYGELVGRPSSSMPTGGHSWLPTRQPMVVDLWDVAPPRPSTAFTTVMNWTAYGDRVHEGVNYGQKDREFEPYFTLPGRVGAPFEIALGAAPPEVADRFRQGGWRVADPLKVSKDPFTYQTYLRGSKAEFAVAKHGYVSARCGWFSDRSCGYLATGRPVILQDTGFSDVLPVGKGLLSYTDPGEAERAIAEVNEDYEDHCRAARLIVEEFFDSDRVLAELLEKCLP